MQKDEQNIQITNEANIKLNRILEDGDTPTSVENLTEETAANLKLDAAMNKTQANHSDPAPTYLYNNTPAIKINEKVD